MKKIKILTVFFICLFIFTNAFCAQDKEDERFFVASKAFSDGFYEASLSLFKKFTEDFPEGKNFYIAKLYMAKCYYYKGNYTAALPILNDLALKKEAADIIDEVYYWLAEVYSKGKNFKDSLLYAQKIIEQYPSSKFIWQAYYIAGLASFEVSNEEKAEEYLKEIIAKSKDADVLENAYSSLLNFYFQKKDFSHLASLAQDYIKTYPKGMSAANAYFYLGESLYAQKDLDKAIHNYRRALELSNDTYIDDLIYQSLAFCLIAKGNVDEARSNISEIKDEQLKSYCEGVYYFKIKDYQKALEVFEKFVKTFPQSKIITSVYLTKADALYEMGRINDSLSAYKYILDSFNDKSYADILDKAHYGLAWCYLKKGEFKRAIDEFKNTLKYTNNPVVMVSSQVQIADAYQEAGNFSQALDIYNEILSRNQNTIYDDYIQFQIGMILLKTKKLEESLIAFRNLQKNFPSSKLVPQAEYYLAVGYFSNEAYQDAINILEDFIKNFPQNELIGRAQYLYGKCFFNEKKYDKALEVFKNIVAKSSDKEIEELVYIDIGNCYLNLSEFEKAKKTWEEFLTKFTSSSYRASVALYLGGLYEKEKKYTEAQNYYQMVLDNYQDSSVAAEAMLSLGHLYWLNQDLEKAELYFKKLSLADNPLSLKSKLYLAKIYAQKGLNKEALGIYGELMDSSSDVVKAAMLEKAFLLKDIKEYKQAIQLFKKSIQEGVDSPKIRFSLGNCLEKNNQDNDAIEEYLKAVYLFSVSKTQEDENDYSTKAYFRIAKIYEKQNKIDAAKEIYRKISSLDTEESKIAKARLEELQK